MMRRNLTAMERTAKALFALLALLVLGTDAFAQFPGGGGGGAGGTRGGMGSPRGGPPSEGVRRGPAAETPLSPGALVQVELDRLEDDLRLTPAQLDAWRAYADKVQKLADDTARSRLDARLSTPAKANAVEELELIAVGIRGRASAIDEIVDAGRGLYATLTPDQKAIADRHLALPVSLLATGVMPPGMSSSATGTARRSAP